MESDDDAREAELHVPSGLFEFGQSAASVPDLMTRIDPVSLTGSEKEYVPYMLGVPGAGGAPVGGVVGG